jgi:hypothetical protein
VCVCVCVCVPVIAYAECDVHFELHPWTLANVLFFLCIL